MAIRTKIRVRRLGSNTEVLALVNHPMTSPVRGDPDAGQPASGHYIEKVFFHLNGALIAEADLGPDVARNPLTGVVLTQAKAGDVITVRWTDNRGGSDHAEARVT